MGVVKTTRPLEYHKRCFDRFYPAQMAYKSRSEYWRYPVLRWFNYSCVTRTTTPVWSDCFERAYLCPGTQQNGT